MHAMHMHGHCRREVYITYILVYGHNGQACHSGIISKLDSYLDLFFGLMLVCWELNCIQLQIECSFSVFLYA